MTFDGQAAIADPANSRMTASTTEWTVDDAGIDQFELEASRRILANLRGKLYGQPMWDLIGEDVKNADEKFHEWYDASDGEYKGGEVTLKIADLTTDQLFEAIMQTLGAAMLEGEARRRGSITGVFPAHPEHYGLSLDGPGGVETMGGMPTLTYPAYVDEDEIPDFIRPLIDADHYDMSKVGRGLLSDGTVQTYVLQQFRDTDEGIEASLWIWYPAACPDSVFKEHLQHYAVEFRNGVRMATAMLAQDAAAPEEELEIDAPAGASTGGLDGTWRIGGSMGPAKREFEVTIVTDGRAASGTVTAPEGKSADLSDGKVAGDSVVFRANLGMKLTFRLTADGDDMTGTMKAGIMPAIDLSGHRLS